jgi:PKD repeat protein
MIATESINETKYELLTTLNIIVRLGFQNVVKQVVVIILVLFSSLGFAQCPSNGLRDGSFNGWNRYFGVTSITSDISGIDANNPTTSGSLFQRITDTTLTDPFTNNTASMVAPGLDYSIRIGDGNDGGKAERMTTSFVVYPENALLTFKYSVVSQSPNHPINWQPIFGARLTDQNDSIVFCTDLVFIPKFSSIPTYNFEVPSTGQKINYTRWRTVSFDLTPYIGQTMSFEIANGDCVLGSHFSYAYFAFDCNPFKPDYQFCLKDGGAEVTAPPGFKTYSWNNGDNQQTTQFVNAQDGDSVICSMTSDNGCVSELSAALVATDVSAAFDVEFDTSLIAAVFTNNSTSFNASIDRYIWDFGDGDSAYFQNPVHEYDSFGVYTIKLMVFNDSGCVDSTSRQYINYPPAYPAFEIEDSCGLNVQFIDLTTPPLLGDIDKYVWEFGDGKTSNKIAPKHMYAAGGPYSVKLTVTANLIQTTVFEKEISIYPFPKPNFISEPACIENPTQFFDRSTIDLGSIVNWDWKFGNEGTGDSTLERIIFQNPGLIDVSLTVISDANCVADTVKEVEVYPQTLNAKFGFEEPRVEVLYPFTTVFDSSINAVSWQWFVDSVFYSNEQNPYLSFEREVADYNVFLVIENDFGCIDTASKTFVVEPIFALYFPNAYTPDGDGINDEYVVRGEGINEFQIIIRDRWGKQIAEGNSLNEAIAIPAGIAGTVLQYEAFITDKNGLYHYREGLISVIK